MEIKIKKLEHFDNNYWLPYYATEGATGMDILAMNKEDIVIKPTEIAFIPTGFSLELPKGYGAQIFPRSGLGSKGITIPNSPGLIDSDYRGEVKAILLNLSKEDFVVKKGDRIAQMVINRFEKIEWWEIEGNLSDTKRGDGGFGHTGR